MTRSTVLFVLLVLVFSSSTYSQDTIYTEDFSEGFNKGWTTYKDASIPETAAYGQAIWDWRGPETEPYDVYYPLDGPCNFMGKDVDDLPFDSQLNGYMAFDGNMWDMGVNDESICASHYDGIGEKPGPYLSYLESPNFDLSLLDKPVLSCKMLARSFDLKLHFEYSLDDGNTWQRGIDLINVYGNDIEGEVQVNLKPFAANKSRFKFRFLYAGYSYHVLLDDMVIENLNYAVPQIFEVWKNPVRPVYDLDFYQMPITHLKSIKPGMTISVEANEDIEVTGVLKVNSPSSFQSFKKSFSLNADSSFKKLQVEFDDYLIEEKGNYYFEYELRVNDKRVKEKGRENFEITESLYSPAGLDKALIPHNYPKYYDYEVFQSFKPNANDTIFGIEFSVFNSTYFIENFDLQTYEGDVVRFAIYEVENLESYRNHLEQADDELINFLNPVASQEMEILESMIGIDDYPKSRFYFDSPVIVDTSKFYLYSIYKEEGNYMMPVYASISGSNVDLSSIQKGNGWSVGSQSSVVIYTNVRNYLKLLLGESRVGINKNELNKLSVFPNPADDVINIRINNKGIIQSISLFQTDGRLIKKLKVNGICNAVFPVDEVNTGNYILEINTSKGIVRRSVAIQN